MILLSPLYCCLDHHYFLVSADDFITAIQLHDFSATTVVEFSEWKVHHRTNPRIRRN